MPCGGHWRDVGCSETSHLVDVVVPGPWWNALTYEADRELGTGVRVRVPVGRGERVGFVLGAASAPPGAGARRVTEPLDEGPPLDPDLWDLALWTGRAFLCGPGMALKTICPQPILDGSPVPLPSIPDDRSETDDTRRTLHETSCFDPRDDVRMAAYVRAIERELASGGRVLFLLSEARAARDASASFPDALLWPSTGGKRLWRAWLDVRSGGRRLVVGPPGAVLAPLRPTLIIVEDEANPAYVSQRPPHVNARSLAGRRALALGAELLLGGRMPSSKTFLRVRPPCTILPDRKRAIFVDMRRSIEMRERGIEGALPLTRSLIERTREALGAGHHALWILDRRGEAAEVSCAECGRAIRCPRCASPMRVSDGGGRLRCIRCGARMELPSRCPGCKGELWVGRRPGLDALASMAGRIIRGAPIVVHEAKGRKGGGVPRVGDPSLVLGTRGALALCDRLDVALIGWLDLDAELRRPDHAARSHAFAMAWESCWRGTREGAGRTVLIQSRREGGAWRDALMRGWERSWDAELRIRGELGLPPHALMIQIDLPKGEDRAALTRALEGEGLFVMDPGEEGLPLWTSARSVEPVLRGLAPRFHISRSRDGFPLISVWTD